jgi:hypothetical protein
MVSGMLPLLLQQPPDGKKALLLSRLLPLTGVKE